MKPFIAEYAYMPLGMIPGGAENMRKLLTIKPTSRYGQDEPVLIPTYSDAVPGFLGLPIDWAVRRFPHVVWEDRTTLGGELVAPSRPDPYHPKAAPGQAGFMDELIKAVGSNLTVFAMADTGTGKTVCSLNTAAHFGRRTLVLCHLDRLCNQWGEEAVTHLGLRANQIGRVQQDRCDHHLPISVGTMHSVSLRQYPLSFYRAFGMVIWDEVDVCGAPLFAETLGLFPAAYKLAVSATKNRRDGTAKIYLQYFGEPAVVSKAEALPMKAFVIPYEARMPVWGKQHQTVMKCLSLDVERNNLLFDIIMLLNTTNRSILVVGERIEHLQHLMERCMAAGIPEDEIGQYTGQVYTGKVVLKEIDGVMQKVKETAKVTTAYLNWAKKHARVFFATYKMIERGIDIPRLDAGVDATPRPDATQIIGRIRRPVPGKPLPVWYTIRDDRSPRLLGYLKSRLKDYQATGVEVEVA